MREAESLGNAARTEERTFATNAKDIKNGLKPTNHTDNGTGDEECFEQSMSESFGRAKERRDIKDSENRKEEKPDDTGGEKGAGSVGGPEDREGGVEREKTEEEEFAISDSV